MKTILITGSSSGVGLASAEKFLSAGWRVIGLSRSAGKVFRNRDNYIPLELDLADSSLKQSLEEASREHAWNALDGLLLNAAGFLKAPFEALTLLQIEELYRVNVFSGFLLMQWAKPLLMKAKQPQVLMISSMGGVQGTQKFSGLSVYSSSKGAQSVLAECLAEEWKETGIRVNVLALGSVNTPMLREAFPGFAASMEPEQLAGYLLHWMEGDGRLYNGKILPLSSATP